MIQKAYEDSALAYCYISKCLNLFKTAHEEVDEDFRSGWPPTSTNDKMSLVFVVFWIPIVKHVFGG